MTPRDVAHLLLLLSCFGCRSFDSAGFEQDGGRLDGPEAGTAGDTGPRSDGAVGGTDTGPRMDTGAAPVDTATVDAVKPPDGADVAVPSLPDAAAEAPVVIPPVDAPPACMPVPEICDRKDNDCDGQVDEGFGAANIGTTYSALATFHGACNAQARFGPACNAAAHRFCVARGCQNTGFGPLENSGDVAAVGCVSGALVRTVAIGTLTTHHPDCQAASHHSPACNAAINRFCAAQGHLTGFGPAEFDGQFSLVACLSADRAVVITTSYTTLTTHHPGCTAGGERFGPACNAAINRFCAAQGHLTGFGPVENSGDVAVVVCVKA